jgi:hypothetical protein
LQSAAGGAGRIGKNPTRRRWLYTTPPNRFPREKLTGSRRKSAAPLPRFLPISPTELECQLLLARNLKLLRTDNYEELSLQTVEVKRTVTVLVQKLTAER